MRILKRLKQMFGFTLTAVIALSLCLLLFTESGISFMYPYAVRLHVEEFTTGSNSYAVYYACRGEISDADIIILGMKESVSESYEIASHFLRFIKQYNNVQTVLLDTESIVTTNIKRLMTASSEDIYNVRLDVLRQKVGKSLEFTDFASILYYLNKTAVASKQFTVESYADTGNGMSTAARIYSASNDALNNGRSTFVIVDYDELTEITDELKTHMDALGQKLVTMRIEYSDCSDADGEVNTLKLPFTPDSTKTYFVDCSAQDKFLSYADKIRSFTGGADAQPYSEKLTEGETEWFFVISKAGPAEYYVNEAEANIENENTESEGAENDLS